MAKVRNSCIWFNDQYLFDWISSPKESIDFSSFHVPHRTLHSFFLFRSGSLDGIMPFPPQSSFSWCPSPVEMESKFNKMRDLVPPWYWQRLRFCAFHYFSFWNFIWPGFAEVTNELCFLEWLLYLEPGNLKYRDHILHMFKVACVGTWFLDQEPFFRELVPKVFSPRVIQWAQETQLDHKLIKLLSSPGQNLDEASEIVRWAFLFASLLHDFGYAFSFRKEFDSFTSRINRWMANSSFSVEPSPHVQILFMKSLAGSLIEKVAQNNTPPKTLPRRLSGTLRDHLVMNHSFPSALFVLELENELRQAGSVNDRIRIALHLAAEAIMLHDLTRNTNTCGVGTFWAEVFAAEPSPLSGLLVLCDEVAIWNRPRLETSPHWASPNHPRLKARASPNEVLLSFHPKPRESVSIGFEDRKIQIFLPRPEVHLEKEIKKGRADESRVEGILQLIGHLSQAFSEWHLEVTFQ